MQIPLATYLLTTVMLILIVLAQWWESVTAHRKISRLTTVLQATTGEVARLHHELRHVTTNRNIEYGNWQRALADAQDRADRAVEEYLQTKETTE